MYYCALPPAMNESFYCSTSCQHLVLLVFWILVILIGVQWYLVLVCISLMTYDVEQLFIYLITISVSPLMGCLLRSLVCFLIILFIFLLMSFKSSQYIWDISHKSLMKVTQLCPTLCDPKDYTHHGILQARTLTWVAFPFSRGSSQPRA